MPFGLRNAAQSFQRMMDKVFAGLPFVFIYLDDILIASATFQDHQQHLRQVFSLLTDNGLRINADKCDFSAALWNFWDTKWIVLESGLCNAMFQLLQSFQSPQRPRSCNGFWAWSIFIDVLFPMLL
jgi:hypothetical protein